MLEKRNISFIHEIFFRDTKQNFRSLGKKIRIFTKNSKVNVWNNLVFHFVTKDKVEQRKVNEPMKDAGQSGCRRARG